MFYFIAFMMVAFGLLFAALMTNAIIDGRQFPSLNCHPYSNSGGRLFWIAIMVSFGLLATNLSSMNSFSILSTLGIVAIFAQAIMSIWTIGVFEKFRNALEGIATTTFFGKLCMHRKTSFLDAVPPDVQSSRRFNYTTFSYIGQEQSHKEDGDE